MPSADSPSPLAKHYPGLARLPRAPLVETPTPVFRIDALTNRSVSIYVKDDGACASPYGGNKVRKLEYLLGAAVEAGATEILTSGSTSSNHALATTIYAASLGLRTTVLLVPHPSTRREPLLIMHRLGAALELQQPGVSVHPHAPAHASALERMRARGARPFVIPFGGTTPEGTLGFVSAIIELQAQITAGVLPEPDRILVPLGSFGTAAGIALGLEVTRMRAEVVAVRAVDQPATTDDVAVEVERARALARTFDAHFPAAGDARSRVRLCDTFAGGRSGSHTEESRAAARLARAHGLRLEDPYATKAFAALADEAALAVNGEVLLYWRTDNSHDLDELARGVEWDELPEGLREAISPIAEMRGA